MSCARLVPIVLSIFVAATPAFAQGGMRAEPSAQTFDSVSVKPSPPPGDPSFAAFRKTLAAVARNRVFEELARNVVSHGFFWDHDFANGFDPRRTGADNLAAAIRLEHGFGAGWEMLADFAAEPTATETPAMPGVLCAPGRPSFDQDDFDRLVDSTHSSPNEWVYPRAAALALRAAARSSANVVETLGNYFVRVIRFETVPANADPLHTAWTRIATPAAKIGYAAPDTLASLSPARLCYIKDVTGRWSIAGFIGAAN
jgi:hypothetical protein